MKIGIISDTHNQIELMRKSLRIFEREGVEMIVHAGDMDTVRAFEEFREVKVPIKMVIGNIDEEPERYLEKAQGWGLDFFMNSFVDFEIGGKRIYVFHGKVLGKLEDVLKVLVDSGKYDVVIHGHTHRPRCEVRDGVLILNPGSLVSIKPSVAIYDVDAGEAQIVNL